MTLVELRYVVAVAAEKHFGRAARACHVSQPTLSAAVKNLEEELGVSLFERGAGGVRVTPAGERAVAQARRVLDEAEKVKLVALAKEDPLARQLRIGAIATLAPYAIAPLILPLRKAHRELEVLLREGLTQELVSRLLLGELDMVMAALPTTHPGLASEPLFDEPFVALLSTRSPLARRRTIRPDDLAGERLILLTEGHCFREHALAVCRGHTAFEDPDRDPLAATSLHTVVRMVEAEMGATLMPRLAADDLVGATHADVCVKPLAPPAPSRRIGIVWRQGSAAEAAARAIAAFLRAHLPPSLVPVGDAPVRPSGGA